MLVTIATAVAVPVVAVLGSRLGRGQVRRVASDVQGIAMQTVIIMVVLIAIAGGVAGVLLTSGQDATTNLQNTEIDPDAASYTIQALCEAAGHDWTATTTNVSSVGCT